MTQTIYIIKTYYSIFHVQDLFWQQQYGTDKKMEEGIHACYMLLLSTIVAIIALCLVVFMMIVLLSFKISLHGEKNRIWRKMMMIQGRKQYIFTCGM